MTDWLPLAFGRIIATGVGRQFVQIRPDVTYVIEIIG